jgi:hypothetical protein
LKSGELCNGPISSIVIQIARATAFSSITNFKTGKR